MGKVVTVYMPVGCIYGDLIAYPSYSKALSAARRVPEFRYPNGIEVRAIEYKIPKNSFWTGDLIDVDLHRTRLTDFKKMESGEWSTVTGRVIVDSIYVTLDEINGHLIDPSTDQFIVKMPLHAGRFAFPFRNAQLCDSRADVYSLSEVG